MCRKKIIFILTLLILLSGKLYAVSTKADSLYPEIKSLSCRYLNYNCSTNNDSIVTICKAAAEWYMINNDHVQKFQTEQLIVNALCLTGHIDGGISIAKEMYKTANALNHSLGKALALQAMGATFMHTGQYTQALSTFSEARPQIYSEGDFLAQAQLTTQQLHCCMYLEDTTEMVLYIIELNRLIPLLPTNQQELFLFYKSSYETIFDIKTGQAAKAQESLNEMLKIMPTDQGLNIWRYFVQAFFYKHLNKTQQELAYVDSTLAIISQQGLSQIYQDLVYEKAAILEKDMNYSDACSLYGLADSLTNVLDMERYIKQVEDLHQTYYVDLENARLRNKFLSYILLCSFIGIMASVVLIIIARKRNKQLTQSREKLDKLRQITTDSIQSKSIFLSNMSHDLRTPLNAIVGFSEILTTEEDIDPELKEQCRDNIKQNSDLLLKLTNDIIDFSTLKEAKIKFDFGKYEIVSLCGNVIKTIAKVKQTEAQLVFKTTIEHLEIETDSERLQQVLINLLTNAAKFTKTGSIRLLLDFDQQKNQAIFTVEDTGCGIPLEKQATIFQRFEKLHESVQGVGLGLSICKLIVDHVNGNIWIDSAYTQGARFVFTHPINHTSKQSGA